MILNFSVFLLVAVVTGQFCPHVSNQAKDVVGNQTLLVTYLIFCLQAV